MTPSRTAGLATAIVAVLFLAAACGTDTATPGDDTTPASIPLAADTAVAPVPSPGCDTGTNASAVTEERREVATIDPNTGEPRWYLISTPDSHDGVTPMPLVLDFHGLSEGAPTHAAHSRLGDDATARGYTVVFPHGTGTPLRWSAVPADVPLSADATASDITYIEELLDAVTSDWCIDTARVFATGLSNGAGMATHLGCVRTERIAAIAPVAGLRPPLGCDDAGLPVVAFHGTADAILIYNGGIGDLAGLIGGTATPEAPPAEIDGPGYPAAARAWATHNGCEADPDVTEVGADVQHWVFTCPEGADVEFYVIIDGGHTWPDSDFSRAIGSIVGPTTATVSANEVMLDFFERVTPRPASS